MRKRNLGKRIMTGALAVMLALQSPIAVLAEEDVTNSVDTLKLALSTPWYEDVDGNHIALADAEERVDYSAIPEALLAGEAPLTLGMSVEYSLSGTGDPIYAGDWFQIVIPEWMENLTFTEEGTKSFLADGSEAEGEGVSYEWAEDSRELKVTFTEDVGTYGEIGIEFELKEDALTEEAQEMTIVLQGEAEEQTAQVLLPAKNPVEEEGKTESGAAEESEEEEEKTESGAAEESKEEEEKTESGAAEESEEEEEKTESGAAEESEEEEDKTNAAADKENEAEQELTAATEAVEEKAAQIEYEESAQTQILWQDQVDKGEHMMLPGTIHMTWNTKTVSEAGTETSSKATSVFIPYNENGELTPGEDTAELWALLGWNEGEVPKVVLSQQNNLNQTLELKKLPSKVTVPLPSEVEGETAGTVEHTFTEWEIRVDRTKIPAGYLMAEDTSNHVYTLTPTTEFTANVEIRSGASVDDIEWNLLKENLQMYATVGGTEVPFADLMKRFAEQNSDAPKPIIELVYHENGRSATLHVTGIPWCDANKTEIVYSAAVQGRNEPDPQKIGIDDGSKDYLQQSINNATSTNFGSVTDVVHEGGLLVLTRHGVTTFTANKIWLDADENGNAPVNRPETTWMLWRYTRGQGSYQQAAPVRDTNSNSVFQTIPSGSDTKPMTSISIIFDGTEDTNAAGAAYELPKYDADGEAYVYFVKESMTGDAAGQYEKVFGGIQLPGGTEVTDVAPNWLDGANVQQEGGEVGSAWVRDPEESCVYHEGTICNRRTDTIAIAQKKVWHSGNYQDDLHDVEVDFTLQRRPKGNEDTEWADTENVSTLKDFTPENLTGTVSASVPMYDELGCELEYRWIETGVYEMTDGNRGENLLYMDQESQERRFKLSHNIEAEKIDGEEYYVSETVGEQNEYGYEAGTIVNRLVGKTSYDVKKKWNIEEALIPDSITIQLERRSTDGVVTKTEHKVTKEAGWHLEIAPLEKYDKDGRRYEYTVEELGNETQQYTAEYDYNSRDTKVDEGDGCDGSCEIPTDESEKDVNNVLITNNPVGLGKQIRIRKEWLDDGDVAHREPVTVKVYRNAIDGNPLDDGKDAELANVTLTADNQWWSYVNVTEFSAQGIDGETYVGTRSELEALMEAGKVEQTDFTAANLLEGGTYYIQEISMGAKEERLVDTKTRSLRGYPLIVGGDGTDRKEHGYEVLYANPNADLTAGTKPDNEGYYTVYNRRIGQIDIDVTKKWIDGGKTPEERAKYEASIQVVGEGVKYVTEGENSGLWIGNDGDFGAGEYLQPILDSKGNVITDTQLLIGGTKVGILKRLAAGLTGKTDETEDAANTEKVSFYNLPKYDYAGRVIHYSIQEIDKDDKLQKAEYVNSVNDLKYDEIGDDKHGSDGHDTKEVEVINQRSKTKSIEFHKRWIDQAAYEAGNRPDIFLMLYRLDSSCEELTPVPHDYVEHAWEPRKDESAYMWTCTFDNLPKYDSEGAEIIYYAEERTHAHPEDYDYLDVQYGSTSEDESRSVIGWDEKNSQYTVTHTLSTEETDKDLWVLKADDGTENGKAVVKEEGWFINRLRANVTIDGQKVWENIPKGFPATELPKLNFILTRKLKGSTTAATQVAKIENVGTKDGGLRFEFFFKHTGLNDLKGEYIGELPTETKDAAWEKLLPRYDEKGQLYEYEVSEEIADGQAAGVETAYEKLPGEVHNYTITNTYDIGEKDGKANNIGSIVITKDWENNHRGSGAVDKAEGISAEGIFELYRFCENAAGDAYIAFEHVATKNAEVDADGSKVVFEKQPVNAPNGKQYFYFIKERDMGGFEQNVQVDQNTVEVEKPQSNIEGYPEEAKDADVFRFKKKMDGAAVSYVEANVEASNIYELTNDDMVSLQTAKIWDDYDNLTGIRPKELSWKLYRFAARQEGASANNAIADQYLGTITFTSEENGNVSAKISDTEAAAGQNILKANADLSVTASLAVVDGKENQNQWNLTIGELDRYAPNGSPWQYKLIEDVLPTGYEQDRQMTSSGTTPNEQGIFVLKPITNKSGTEFTVRKEWNLNSALQVPETEYALQVKEDNGSWQWAAAWAESLPASVATAEEALASIISTKVIAAGETSATWKNLPKCINVGDGVKNLTWRAVEIRIGDKEDSNHYVRFGNGGEQDTYQAADDLSTLSCEYAAEEHQPKALLYYPTQAEESGATKIVNSPLGGVVSLEITKTWEKDNNNSSQTRPGGENWSVSYLIERRSEGTETFETVPGANGEPYVVTIKNGSANPLTITGLPKWDENGTSYEYVAREAVQVSGEDEKKEWKVVDNETYQIPGYTVSGNTNEPNKNEAGTTYYSGTTNTFETAFYLSKTDEKGNPIVFYPKIGQDGTLSQNQITFTLEGNDEATRGWRAEWTLTQNADQQQIESVKVYKDAAGADTTVSDDTVGSSTPVYTADNTKNPEKHVEIQKLPLGSYKLTETVTPDYYLPLNGEHIVALKADTKKNTIVEVKTNSSSLVSAAQTEYMGDTLSIANKVPKLTFQKKGTDDQAKKLAGAVFTIAGSRFIGAYADETSVNVTTDGNGEIVLNGVLVRSVGADEVIYTVKETTPPEGYQLIKEELRFKLNERGEVIFLSNGNDGQAVDSAIEAESAETAQSSVKAGYTLTTSSAAGNVITATDEWIESVSLEITKTWEKDAKNQYKTRPAAQGADGQWEVNYLIMRKQGNGDYENVPKEKDSDEPYVVTIRSNEADKDTVTISDLPKCDIHGTEYLYVAREAVKTEDKDGKTLWQVIDNKTYQIPGYTVSGNDVDAARTEEGGKVTYKSQTTNTFETAFYLNKTDEQGNPILFYPKNGADGTLSQNQITFVLEGKDAATSGWRAEWTLTQNAEKQQIESVKVYKDAAGADAAGADDTATSTTPVYTADNVENPGKHVAIKKLPLGRYELTETKTPDNYLPITGTYDVTLTADVEKHTVLRVEKENDSPLTVTKTDSEEDTLSIANKTTGLMLWKQGIDEADNLEGAVFTLSGSRFAGEYAGKTSVEVTTGKGGKLMLDGLLVRSSETEDIIYTLKEKTPPKGYQLLEDVLEFKLDEKGELVILSGAHADENAEDTESEQTGKAAAEEEQKPESFAEAGYYQMTDKEGNVIVAVDKVIPLVNLQITKMWEKDAENQYQTRPTTEDSDQWEVHYLIMRKQADGVYETIPTGDHNEAPYVIALRSDEKEQDTITVENLPGCDIYGNAYTYAAREAVQTEGADGTEEWQIVDNEAYRIPGYTVSGNEEDAEETDMDGTVIYMSRTINTFEAAFYLNKTGEDGKPIRFQPKAAEDGRVSQNLVAFTLEGNDKATEGWRAEWTLMQNADGTRMEYVKVYDGIAKGPVYSDEVTYDPASGEPAHVAVKKLPLGSYKLTETETPEQYLPMTEIITVVLKADGAQNTVVEVEAGNNLISVTGTDSEKDTLRIVNEEKPEPEKPEPEKPEPEEPTPEDPETDKPEIGEPDEKPETDKPEMEEPGDTPGTDEPHTERPDGSHTENTGSETGEADAEQNADANGAETGDHTRAIWYLGLMLAACVAGQGALAARKKYRK